MNPSFESYTACPNGAGQVNRATDWDTCYRSADYFNSCSSISQMKVPSNYFGYQQAFSGNAYSGFYTYSSGGFYREIITGKLSNTLTIGQKYFISYKVSRADSNYVTGYATNKLGVRFSTMSINNIIFNNWAHYYSNNVITDTLNWTKLFGSFTADSAYKFIMLGNFFDDANTTKVNDLNGGDAYYYVDDICLSTDSLFSYNYSFITGTRQYLSEVDIKIFPNPANRVIIIDNLFDTSSSFKIYNSLNIEVMNKTELKGNSITLDCSTWPQGLYILIIQGKQYKIIINH